jgi:hypothetical protein
MTPKNISIASFVFKMVILSAIITSGYLGCMLLVHGYVLETFLEFMAGLIALCLIMLIRIFFNATHDYHIIDLFDDEFFR